MACRASEPQQQAPGSDGEEVEGLLPEEDEEVSGTYMDAMNGNTKLGKAIRSAVKELSTLNDMEVGVLKEADDLLQKLGVKGSLFGDKAAEVAELLATPRLELDEEDFEEKGVQEKKQ